MKSKFSNEFCCSLFRTLLFRNLCTETANEQFSDCKFGFFHIPVTHRLSHHRRVRITLIQPVVWEVNGLVTITVITTAMVHHLMRRTKAAKKGEWKKNVWKFSVIAAPMKKFSLPSHTNNILTKEELEARHHAEGVDAFLTFATEVSSMSSPIKRPPSPDSYNGSYVEHIPNGYYESSIIHHSNGNHFGYLSSPPPPKKSRSRTLRTKLKKKAWLR